MTEKQTKKLSEYYLGKVESGELAKELGDKVKDVNFIKQEIATAIDTKSKDIIERAIDLMWYCQDYEKLLGELNTLLLEPNHRSHQWVTKKIQDIGHPSSIPFIRKALETNFEYLEYTCSDTDVIAKWFSWALFSIGTKEAIDLIKEYAKSEDEGIRKEMTNRLNKL